MAGADVLGFDVSLLTFVAAGAVAAWLIALAVVDVARRPAAPHPAAPTMELGQEPPAVANFLTNGFRVTPEAVPATVLDLAARDVLAVEERGFGHYVCRVGQYQPDTLSPYEERIVELVRRRQVDGFVPAEALTTGNDAAAKRWLKAFGTEVVEDAKRRGLSQDNLTRTAFAALTLAALVPAALIWALSDFRIGAGAFLGALFLLTAARARHQQRETPLGLETAGRWLGVRASLVQNEVFGQNPPIAVAIWDRYLAYGAALGVAPAAAAPLRLGTESATRAWSAVGGRWREVKISYPGSLPLGWGRNPLAVLGIGIGVAVVALFMLIKVLPAPWDLPSSGAVRLIVAIVLAVPIAALALALVVVARAVADLVSPGIEVTGRVLRLRVHGSKEERHYVAVDDGTSDRIRAWLVSPTAYAGLQQDEDVEVEVTRGLHYVRSIRPLSPA
jgi:hypothetical protein